MSYFLTDRFVAEWNRIRRKVDTLRGQGVTNAPDAITINAPQARQKDAARPARRGPIVVELSNATGSAGSSSAYSDYTYTATDAETGVELATEVAVVENGRPIKAEVVTVATWGLAFWDEGTLKLTWTNEQWLTDPCV